jgi:threonine synthase
VIAGARRYARTAAPGETIVTAFTGHGLKSAAKVAELMESF